MAWRLIPELPLLRRELIELANRKRTYVVRVIGAAVLLFLVFSAYTVAVGQWIQDVGVNGVGNRYFGIGGPVFHKVVPLLFYAIQILLPALCCTSITMEKERNTIGTLFLTRLSPWAIVLEKVLSRIVPMLTILLLASPLLAYVYSLGGVDTSLLVATFWLLFCECLLFASLAIMCSSYFPTTVSAFIGSYLLIAVLGVFSAAIGFIAFVPSVVWERVSREGLEAAMVQRVYGAMPLPPGVAAPVQSAFAFVSFLLLTSLPSLIVAGICLTLARVFLIRRAFVSTSSVLLRVFKAIDSFFTRLNDRTTGGIEIIADSSPLPDTDPVAWRERNKKSLGKARYLFRILLCLEGPTLFICAIAASESSRQAFDGLYFLEGVVWALAVMITAVKAATLFSSERAKETIEPLLATPLSMREILNQKIAGMRRLLIVVACPILTVNLTFVLVSVSVDRSTLQNPAVLIRPLAYLALSVLVVGTLLYLTVWLCAAIGLKIHSQTKAVLVSVSFVGLWAVLPWGLADVFPAFRDFLRLLSPVTCVALVERVQMQVRWLTGWQQHSVGALPVLGDVIPVLLCLAVYVGVLLTIRHFVLTMAPRLLNRLENPVVVDARVPPSQAVAAVEG